MLPQGVPAPRWRPKFRGANAGRSRGSPPGYPFLCSCPARKTQPCIGGKGLLSDLPKVLERAVTKQLTSVIPRLSPARQARGRQDSLLVRCSGFSRASIRLSCLARRYQRRRKVCCRLIRVQSCIFNQCLHAECASFSPPAGVRVAGSDAASGRAGVLRLLEKRYTPIKPTGQHLTPGVLVKEPCVFAYVKQAL